MSASDRAVAPPALSLAIRVRFWQAGIEVALMRVLALLPLRVLRWLGAGLGTVLWPLARERRLITLRNLELCFPEKSEAERMQLAKQNFRNTAIGFMETAKIWYTAPERIKRWVEVEGLEHLQAASARGKGVLVLGFHLTDLELGAVAVAHFTKLAGMYRPHADPVFEAAMRRGRERHFPMIPRDDVRGMLRWLKSGGSVWYAADQDYGAQHSVFAPFFGIPAATITATSRFAKLSGAPVVPLTHVRTATGIKLFLHPPLTTIPSGDELADTTTANQFLETWLRQHPADYLWLHRRFKTRPAGVESRYPARTPRHKPDEISGKRVRELISKSQRLTGAETALPCLLYSPQRQTFVLRQQPTWRGLRSSLSSRLRDAADQLAASGVPAVLPDAVLECRALHCFLLRFAEAQGKPVLLNQDQLDEAVVTASASLVASLHRRGLDIPALAWSDFWLQPDGRLAFVGVEQVVSRRDADTGRWLTDFRTRSCRQWQWPDTVWWQWQQGYLTALAASADMSSTAILTAAQISTMDSHDQ